MQCHIFKAACAAVASTLSLYATAHHSSLGPDRDTPPVPADTPHLQVTLYTPHSYHLQLLNKCDLLGPEELDVLAGWYRQYCKAEVVLPISALQGSGLPGVVDWLASKLPESPSLYPKVGWWERWWDGWWECWQASRRASWMVRGSVARPANGCVSASRQTHRPVPKGGLEGGLGDEQVGRRQLG